MNDNEQDLIVKQKIEKREKVDIVLAYILLIILLSCIFIVVYLKFIKKDNDINPEEHMSNYITIEDITSQLNSGALANNYKEAGATFTATTSDNSILVSYKKENDDINLTIPLINNELEINLTDNQEFVTSIYKEIGKIVCMHYGNDENSCENTINSLNADNSSDSIRFVNSDNNNIVYVNITKSVDVSTLIPNNNSESKVYTEETITDILETSYQLNILDTIISDINTANTDSSFMIIGHITSSKEKDTLKINAKLYDTDNKVIGEASKEYTTDSPLTSEDDFTISFELNDNLKLDDIKKYSINVVR